MFWFRCETNCLFKFLLLLNAKRKSLQRAGYLFLLIIQRERWKNIVRLIQTFQLIKVLFFDDFQLINWRSFQRWGGEMRFVQFNEDWRYFRSMFAYFCERLSRWFLLVGFRSNLQSENFFAQTWFLNFLNSKITVFKFLYQEPLKISHKKKNSLNHSQLFDLKFCFRISFIPWRQPKIPVFCD